MPAGRAIWKGHLRISLISVPVSLYNAVSGSERISFNQLHRDCHLRLKQQMVCPKHGQVERSDIVKGYEFTKEQYIIVKDEELERLKAATSKAIEITQFVDEDELDSMYFDSPYYVLPDGPVGEKAYRVIREALAKAKKVGIGQMVMSQRTHMVALRPHDSGFVMTTLRASDEVRKPEEYFAEIGSGEIPKSELKLALDLIENYSEPLDQATIKDAYQEGLKSIINAKLEGKEPEIVEPPTTETEMNFMAALERSLKAAKKKAVAPPKKKPLAKSIKSTAAAAKKRKQA